ncbi:MAG: hypothetical protein ACRCVT_15555 [Leadbetterella sp.]
MKKTREELKLEIQKVAQEASNDFNRCQSARALGRSDEVVDYFYVSHLEKHEWVEEELGKLETDPNFPENTEFPEDELSHIDTYRENMLAALRMSRRDQEEIAAEISDWDNDDSDFDDDPYYVGDEDYV